MQEQLNTNNVTDGEKLASPEGTSSSSIVGPAKKKQRALLVSFIFLLVGVAVFIFAMKDRLTPQKESVPPPPVEAPVSTSTEGKQENEEAEEKPAVAYFSGALGEDAKIQMTLTRSGTELSGSYFYESMGKDLMLKGAVDPHGVFSLEERDETGRKTGMFEGKFSTEDTLEGAWFDLAGNKRTFSLRKGVLSWAKSYGGGNDDYVKTLLATSDGGYLIVGTTASFGAGGSDVWLVKVNRVGAIVWEKVYGDRYTDAALSAVATSDGGYVVVGSVELPNIGVQAWVAKVDAEGNRVWEKGFGEEVVLQGITRAIDGDGYVVSGRRGNDGWVARLTPEGEFVWQKAYGGKYEDALSAVHATIDSKGYIASGYVTTFEGQSRGAWLLKLDENGEVVWQKTYGGCGGKFTPQCYFGSVNVTDDGGYMVTMNAAGYYSLAKLDGEGKIVWEKSYGSADHGDAIFANAKSADGGHVFVGKTRSFGIGNFDIWALKISALQDAENEYKVKVKKENFLWNNGYGGEGQDEATALSQALDGGYMIAGNSTSFGKGDSDVWVLKVDGGGGITFSDARGAAMERTPAEGSGIGSPSNAVTSSPVVTSVRSRNVFVKVGESHAKIRKQSR